MLFTFLGMVVQAAGKVVDWAGRQQELIQAILDGNEEAFTWLVKRHWGGMMRVSRGILGNESIASEVVQETWEAVFKGLESFRGESSLSTWIFRILVNRSRRTGKNEARSIPFSGMRTESEGSSIGQLEDEFTANGRWSSPVHGWSTYDPQQDAINRQGLELLAEGLEKTTQEPTGCRCSAGCGRTGRRRSVRHVEPVTGQSTSVVASGTHWTSPNARGGRKKLFASATGRGVR